MNDRGVVAGILSILGENGVLTGVSKVDTYAEFFIFGSMVISVNVMNRMTMYMMKVK